jgi:hypothetical protein
VTCLVIHSLSVFCLREKILKLTKTEIETLTGILTRHCELRYHMHRLGKSLEDTCRLCMEESETAQHVICECPAAARIRLKRLGKGFMSPQTVKRLKPKRILGFLKAVKLEES